jgi:hypothetical protein
MAQYTTRQLQVGGVVVEHYGDAQALLRGLP